MGMTALIGLLALAGADRPPPGRTALGQHARWAAFRDASPHRCYAVTTPLDGRGGAFLTVASWPGAGVRSQFHLHLARPATMAVAAVGGIALPLAVRGQEAWAADVHADRRLAASLRGGGLLVVRGRTAAGGRFRDVYPLAGAAGAIDAMRLACLGA